MKYDNGPGKTQPFFPNEIIHQALSVLGLLVVLFAVVFFASDMFMPPEVPADPLNTPEHVKPEWYFLPAYQFLKLFPAKIFGRFGALPAFGLQGAFVLALFLLPFLDRSSERDIRKRPRLLALGIGVVAFILILGVWGHYS